MDDDLDGALVRVRADTRGFARDVAEMRAALEGPLGEGAARAGDAIERALLRAVRNGKFGFEDLKRSVLAVMNEIAAAAIRAGIGSISGSGGGGSGGSGLVELGVAVLGSVLGLPGRATGGPVAPGRAYLVGERGPEVFVPTSSGSVAAGVAAPKDVRVSIAVNAPAGAVPEMLARSSRQVARAVRNALREN